MKKFEDFVNEEYRDDDRPFFKYLAITEYIKNTLKDNFKKLHSTESITVSDASSDDDIPNIGKRKDYINADGGFTHIIIGVRIFYSNRDVIEKFNTMTEYGEFLIEIENNIKKSFKVNKISNYNDYFCYLIEINDDLINQVKSSNTIDKYNL